MQTCDEYLNVSHKSCNLFQKTFNRRLIPSFEQSCNSKCCYGSIMVRNEAFHIHVAAGHRRGLRQCYLFESTNRSETKCWFRRWQEKLQDWNSRLKLLNGHISQLCYDPANCEPRKVINDNKILIISIEKQPCSLKHHNFWFVSQAAFKKRIKRSFTTILAATWWAFFDDLQEILQFTRVLVTRRGTKLTGEVEKCWGETGKHC